MIERMRREFDGSFALPARRRENIERESLLAITVAGNPFALRVGEISWLAKGRQVVPVPSRSPSLKGIVGIRGALVSVHGLAVLLGYDGGGDEPWLVLAGREEPVAFAFDRFEAFVRVPLKDVHAFADGEARPRHLREIAQLAPARPIVNLSSLSANLPRSQPR